MAVNVSALAVIPVDAATLSAQDIAFLQQAQLANLTEIAEASAALQNSSSVTTREFARWMLADHAGQATQLTGIAQQFGVTLPTSLDPIHQQEVSQLTSLRGNAFDQAYLQGAVADHQQSITLFQQEGSAGQNQEVVSLARLSLPLLQAHLEQSSILAGRGDPGPGNPALPVIIPPGTPASLSQQDKTFVAQAATSGLAEIAEGQLAVQRGTPAGQEFGRWMIADHTAISKALGTLAQQEGFALPTALDVDQQSELNRLNAAGAGNFEIVYSVDQVIGHQQTLMQFIHEANSGTDPNLVAFAKTAVPILEEHFLGAFELYTSAPHPFFGDNTASSPSPALSVFDPNPTGMVMPTHV